MGGDGLVAARKLHGAGKGVRNILLARRPSCGVDAAAMFGRLRCALSVRSKGVGQSEAVRAYFDQKFCSIAILGTAFGRRSATIGRKHSTC